jgi:hypothetical protein
LNGSYQKQEETDNLHLSDQFVIYSPINECRKGDKDPKGSTRRLLYALPLRIVLWARRVAVLFATCGLIAGKEHRGT